MDREARITEAGDHRFFAGWRSDPFFFDVMGALNNFQFTGNDGFIDKDVCSIVLEVPNSALGTKVLGIWARTVDGRFVAVFAHSLEHIGEYSSEEARRVAGTLLPGILRFDPTGAESYPSNGRALTDDVLDGFISILTNG
jgi:hypothetical protein